jgi:hypothetical protein
MVMATYLCRDKKGRGRFVHENYSPVSEKAKNMFYGQFVKHHCDNPGEWYRHLDDKQKVIEMLQCINTPHGLTLVPDRERGLKIQGKHFS